MRRSRPALLGAAAAALVLLAGPGTPAAHAKLDCKPGYKVQKKKGKDTCVLKPKQPAVPKDAVTPSAITIVALKIEDDYLSATGWFDFPGKVTGTVYGYWLISNGIASERLPFTLKNVNDVDYTPWTTSRRDVTIRGRNVTATLVIGKTRSAPTEAAQPSLDD